MTRVIRRLGQWVLCLGALTGCGAECEVPGDCRTGEICESGRCAMPEITLSTDSDAPGNPHGGGVISGDGDTDSDGSDTVLPDSDTDTDTLWDTAGYDDCRTGDFLIYDALDVELLLSADCIVGSLTVRSDVLVDVYLPNLAFISGDLVVAGSSTLLSLTGLSALSIVGGRVVVENNPLLSCDEACDLLGRLSAEPDAFNVEGNLNDCTLTDNSCL
jgi:hypothetical protein